MKYSDITIMIKIIENKNCPLYDLNDEFRLNGRAFFLPANKPACITLLETIREVRALSEISEANNDTDDVFTCNGPANNCTGSIALLYNSEKKSGVKTDQSRQNDINIIAQLLSGFSIFQSLDEKDIKILISSLKLKLKKIARGDTIISKGEPGVNLFIVLSGKVEVLGDDGVTIAFLGKGEVFGEMSLLSGDAVGATIRVVDPVWILFINGKDFRRVLNQFPSLQMYFARLLARRLAQTNVTISEDFASAMTGKLSEIAPTELLQTLHQNQKTGILSMSLPKGQARIFLREGELLRALYANKKGKEAFFDVLKETDGRFKFTPGLPPEETRKQGIADFMWLLMEGLNRIDEERAAEEDK